MMKTLVFDFFGVVVSEILPVWFEKNCSSTVDFMKIKEEYANKGDLGEITFDELANLIANDFKRDKNELIKEWFDLSVPNQRMINFIRSRKEQKILLSNAPNGLVERIIEKYSLNDLFDEIVVSYKEHVKKPNVKIYKVVEKKSANKEIIFIDDNDNNLIPAEKLGWETIKFKDNDSALKELEERL